MIHQDTPLEKVEALFEEIVANYHEGEKREIRAAVKFLMVALKKLQQHDAWGWQSLVDQYCIMLRNDPEKFARMLDANRGQHKAPQNYN